MAFKDHFSKQSAAYRQFRPTYPPELYAYLATLVPQRSVAWDCATGNGQAAVGLARHFPLVVATDASAAQLAQRQSHDRIAYACATAERVPLKDRSCDLITVAQSAHWFDHPRFHAEVSRVARPEATLAIWTYGHCTVDAGVDAAVSGFNRDLVGKYWPPERHYVDSGYRTLPFPFPRLEPPPFALSVEWGAEDLVRYIGTWSAVGRYRDAAGSDPLPALRDRLAVSWGDGTTRRVSWPLHLIVGRVASIR
ncbi:MAG TPA: class I SAM-dependent methyltransferase [Steroidobacteraceae bacterium]|nr:class I SAM-dependent methyltransferase [Steroidobacteraceae bacterium]